MAESEPSESESPESLTPDQALDLLSDADRRCALAALRRGDGTASLDDLAAKTAALADDARRESVTTDERERLASALHHRHLPRLADAGVVSYDRAESRVELTDAADELRPFLRLLSE